MFSFHYPVLPIWKMCQQKMETDETVNLAEGGVNLLIIRHKLEIELESLSLVEYTFLNTLRIGQSFGAACEKALDIVTDFNITDFFKQHILQGTIVDVI